MNDIHLSEQGLVENQSQMRIQHIPSMESFSGDTSRRRHIKLQPMTHNNLQSLSSIENPELHEKTYDLLQPPKAEVIKRKQRKPSVSGQLVQDYGLANYETAKIFFKSQGYFEKTIDNGSIQYQPTYCSSENIIFLNNFHSIGIYFYFEFLKRFIFLLIFCGCISALQLYNNYSGTGLQGYTKSYSLTLAQTSLGNNNIKTTQQMYLQGALSTLQAVALIVFYIQWRISSHKTLVQYLDNKSIIEPQRYVLTLTGFQNIKSIDSLSYRFKQFLQKQGYNIYECEVIYDYGNSFGKYVKLEGLTEDIRKQRFLLQSTNQKDHQQTLDKKEKQRQQLMEQITKQNSSIKALEMIVHFETKIDRLKFIRSYTHKSKINNCSSNCSRAICCFKPGNDDLFEEQLVLLENLTLGRPDDIYWQNFDIPFCQKFLRSLIGGLTLAISVIVTSGIVAGCMLYASGTASCFSYIPNSFLADVEGDATLLYCFCEQNFISTNTTIRHACSSVSNTVLINNALLILSSVASAITNIVLVFIIELVVKFMKPITRSKQYNLNFIVILIATLINSCFLPLVLNASIFGYTPNAYLRFLKFINFTNIKVVSDFIPDWYAYVSPYYVNLFIIAAIMPWINLAKVAIVNVIRRKYLKGKVNSILQKTADAMIVTFKFDFAAANALVILNTIICFTYSTSLPLLPILHLISLISLFITNKICLLRYSRRVTADEQLNTIIIHILPFLILLNICFSIWALTSATLFPLQLFSKITFNVQVLADTQFNRVLYFLPLTACLVIVIVFIIIDYILIRIIGLCCSRDNTIYPEQRNVRNFFSTKTKHKNMLNSYKISKNPDYKHVVSIVQSMNRKKV